MVSERQAVSFVSATELGSGLGDFTSTVLRISKLLQRTASTLNSAPQQISLPWQTLPQPTLLSQASPAHNVRLLALAPPCWQPQHSSPGPQPQLPAADRGQVYAATLLQHAAFLLLLLVSDTLLLLISGPAVPAHILQLLHVLPKVRQQLLQLIHARQKQARPTKTAKGQQDPEQQQQRQAGGGSPTASVPTEGKPEQQHEQLLQLMQKPATQLHIALQVSTNAEASICVQQAEHTLLKCKAAAAAQRNAASADSSKTQVSSTTIRSSSLLFELAGVHACSDDRSNQTALRRAVLRTIQQQLFNTSALQQQLLDKEQQQQLPTVDRILASLAAAATTATTATGSLPVGSTQNLQQLWQQLLQLLFPAAASNSGSSSSSCHPFYQRVTLQADDAASDDLSADSADDADWDEVDDSWQEVTHHTESAGEGNADSATAPGELLTSAVDPLYQMSCKRCATAARAALTAYLQAVPPRYTATAHESALSSALLQYQSAAAGPAADDVQHQLQQACVAVWQAGRQQCSAVSLTGRPCTLPPHDVDKVPHSSGASFILAAPDGSEQQQQQDDWFSFENANVQAAQQLLQQQQQHRPQHHQAGIHTGMISAVVKLLLPGDTGQDKVSTSRQPHHIQLGSWFSLWQRRPEPAAAGSAAVSAAVTLPGQRWLPGFNKLLQLRVIGSSHATASGAAAEASDADEGTSEDGQPDSAAAAAAGPADSIHILEGILEGINIKGSRGSAPRRRGRGARGAAAAAAGNGSWSDALATSGKRGGKVKVQQPLAAPTAVTLGPEDFPTLSEAATGTKKNLVGDHNVQQQHPAEAGSAASQVRGRQRHKRRDAGSAERLQQQLIQAWGHLDEQQYTAGGTAVPSTYMNAVSSSKLPGPAVTGVAGPADGSSARRGSGRGHRAAAAAAAAVDKPLPAPVTSAGDHAVLATLWIGLEYESLCGERAVLHPAQLLTTVQQQERQRQQEQSTANAAAVAAAAAARNLPGSRGQGRGRARGGRVQRQQQREGSSTAPHSRQLLADTTTSSSSGSSDVPGVEKLVLQDIPLFIHPAAAGLADVGSASASAATAVTSMAAVTALDTQLLQLKRIYVRTPPAPFMFASQPRVVFTAAAVAGAAGSGVDSTAGNAAEESPDQGSSSSGIEFSTCGPTQLPTDSLSVLSLPQLYGAPAGWVQAVAPAAVAAVAAAAVDVGSVSAAAGASGADTADCNSTSSTVASGGVAADPQLSAEVGAIFSTGDTTGAAAMPISCSETERISDGGSRADNNQWLPLIPVKVLSIDADSIRPSTSLQTAATASSGKGGGSNPLVPSPWSAYLCGGSWLHPVALQQR